MLPLFAISNLNQSVLNNLLNYFGGFSSGVFGGGNDYILGIFLFILILGALLLLRATIDLIVVIGFATVLFLVAYNFLPPVIGVIALMAAAGLILLMLNGLLHR